MHPTKAMNKKFPNCMKWVVSKVIKNFKTKMCSRNPIFSILFIAIFVHCNFFHNFLETWSGLTPKRDLTYKTGAGAICDRTQC